MSAGPLTQHANGRRTLLRAMLAAAAAGLALAGGPLPVAAQAAPKIGVVVMHGKASSPRKAVADLASALRDHDMEVANIEMPWAGRRDYDVGLQAGVDEVTQALEGLRAKGATRLFVAGHSQGGLFAVLYGGQYKVDGIVAIAPGGQVDTPGFVRHLGEHVAAARKMHEQGRGAEKASFRDFEGRRGVTPVRTTADSYLSWFDPQGAHTTAAFGRVKEGTPVLYVAPTGDYPALRALASSSFAALPAHPRKQLLEPRADHMGAPAAAAQDIAAWIRAVAGD